MCLAVFFASNKPLPLVEWDKENPAFNVQELNAHERKIQAQFKSTNIVYVGSSQGCGCGFFKDGVVDEELRIVQKDYDSLVSYLKKLQVRGTKLEMYSCWEGDFKEAPESMHKVTLNDIAALKFEFQERAYHEIK